jgi:hypothetical protein
VSRYSLASPAVVGVTGTPSTVMMIGFTAPIPASVTAPERRLDRDTDRIAGGIETSGDRRIGRD